MKFTLAVPFLAVGALAATPVRRTPDLVRRDIATVTSAIANIAASIKSYDTVAKGFTSDLLGLQAASDAIIKSTNDAITSISGSANLALADALTLTPIIQDLTKDTQAAVDDTIAKKDVLVGFGAGSIVEKSFVDQKAAADKLASTITGKVPDSVQSIAAQLAKGISDAIQKGIDAFANTAAPSSAAASSAAASTPAASSPAASSAAASSAVVSSAAASSAAVSSAAASSHAAASSSAPYPIPSGYTTKASGTGTSVPSATSAKPSQFTGAAAPTGVVGYGAAAVAAMVAVVAL